MKLCNCVFCVFKVVKLEEESPVGDMGGGIKVSSWGRIWYMSVWASLPPTHVHVCVCVHVQQMQVWRETDLAPPQSFDPLISRRSP